MKNVNVLMSTYNGEKYIVEQIESIINQKDVIVHLYVRDDGSSDKTINILQNYEMEGKLKLIQGENIGPARSFIELLTIVPVADFYAFSDQDDIWDVDKISVAVKKIENITGPALYHSNLKVVDKNLNFFRNAHNFDMRDDNKYHSLLLNYATGCTEVFNECLREMVIKKKIEYLNMHDWWVYVVCCFFGTVVYDSVPHILYRQHETNVVGTYLKKNYISVFCKKINRLFDKGYQPRYLMANCFVKAYGQDLSREENDTIKKLANYKNNLKSKLIFMIDKKLKTKSKTRNVALIVLSFFELL